MTGFNLRKDVEAYASTIRLDEKKIKSKTINKMVARIKDNYDEDEFFELTCLLYRIHTIYKKILDTLSGSNKNYLDKDDFFQEFMTVLWNCIVDYEPSVGNFSNYFIRTIHWQFSEVKRNSHFSIHCHEKMDSNNQKKVIAFSNNGIAPYIGIDTDLDKRVLDMEVREIIEKTLTPVEFRVINALFFTEEGEKQTTKYVCELLGLDINQVRYNINSAYKKIRTEYPDLYDDYVSHETTEQFAPALDLFNEIDKNQANEFAA